jgi:hypothetical protein
VILHLTEAQARQVGLNAPAKKPSKGEEVKDLFRFQLRQLQHQLPMCVPEHRFAAQEKRFARNGRTRQWRFDWCFPQYQVAVEFEGLVMQTLYEKTREGKLKPIIAVRGRHATAGGFKDDCEKYNAAAILGWMVMRIHRDSVKSGRAFDELLELLHARGWGQS